METNAKKLPKNTLQIDVTIPAKDVKVSVEEVIDLAVKNTEVPGFRKGNAPREKVMEQLDEAKVNGEAINKLIQRYVPQTLKEHHVTAVSNPKVEIVEFEKDKDFKFAIKIAVKPEVKIGEYKKELKEFYKEKVKEVKKINEERLKQGEKLEEPHIHLGPAEVLEVLMKVGKVEISELLTEEEVSRMMARLIDQTKAVGITIQQYLESQGKSIDDIREEYSKIAEENIKAEFILSQLVENLKIEVTDDEMMQMINAAGDENVKKQFESDREKWYIKAIMAKNKVISLLAEEAEK